MIVQLVSQDWPTLQFDGTQALPREGDTIYVGNRRYRVRFMTWEYSTEARADHPDPFWRYDPPRVSIALDRQEEPRPRRWGRKRR